MAPDTTGKTIHLTRHAQAEHNVAGDWSSKCLSFSACNTITRKVLPSTADWDESALRIVRDAKLTPLGQKQSRELNDLTKDTVQQTAQLLVSSPVSTPS